MRLKRDPAALSRGQAGLLLGHEDDEEDDAAGQCDEDGINTLQGFSVGGRLGCKISDPGEDEHDREGDTAGYY